MPDTTEFLHHWTNATSPHYDQSTRQALQQPDAFLISNNLPHDNTTPNLNLLKMLRSSTRHYTSTVTRHATRSYLKHILTQPSATIARPSPPRKQRRAWQLHAANQTRPHRRPHSRLETCDNHINLIDLITPLCQANVYHHRSSITPDGRYFHPRTCGHKLTHASDRS